MTQKERKSILKNIEVWKNRLLDLSMKNQSINYRKTKSQTVEILSPSVEVFLNRFYGLKNLQFANLFGNVVDDFEEENGPKKVKGKRVSFGIELEQKDKYFKNEIFPLITAFQKKYKGNYLCSNLYDTVQNRNLSNLMKKSNLFKEENGINVLYFAVGFLEWYENKESDDKHLAPILFVPVELSKDAYNSPYKVNFLDDEFLLNESFIQKLINDYSVNLNYKFEADKSNYELFVDYKNFILEQVKKINDKRWKIIEEIDLGIFSFSRINMVKDLEENTEKVINNQFVKLISGLKDPVQNIKFTEKDIDDVVNPAEYFHTYNADSSQEIAIQAAISGKSFVLQGPPGTGKSQTITNIITELIARDKKVLFVAEKQAALEVVYNNLKRIGLNDYVLPIHNTKLDKKIVLHELASTLEKGQHNISIEDTFHKDAVNKFNVSHQELLNYPQGLQNIFQPINKSIYQLYGAYFKYAKHPEIIFDIQDVEKVSEQELLKRRKLIDSFHNALNINDFDISKNDWYGLIYEEMSLKQREKTVENLIQFRNTLHEAINFANQYPFLRIKKDIILKSIEIYQQTLEHLTKISSINSTIMSNPNIEVDVEHYNSLVKIRGQIEELKSRIKHKYNLEVINLDAVNYKNQLSFFNTGSKRFFYPGYKKIKNRIYAYKLTDEKLTYAELLNLFNIIEEIQEKEKEFTDISKLVSYRVPLNEFAFLKNTYEHIDWFNTFKQLSHSLEWDSKYIYHLFAFALIQKDQARELSAQFNEIFNKLQKHIHIFRQDFNTEFFDIDGYTFDKLDKKLDKAIHNNEHLTTILEFNRVYKLMKQNHLQEYADALIQRNIKQDYFAIYLRRFYLLLIDKYQAELFPDFNGEVMDSIRKTFAQSDAIIQSMAKTKVEMSIIEKIPNYNSIEGLNSEVSILRTEANKSRRIMPFRLLFDKIPTLITKLKPCLMMSPLSVSSLLKNSNLEFDVVIFDEASQVRPENAIGALSRASQFIISGDKEQLPPTDFFAHFDEDDSLDDNSWDTTAFDSILEVANIVLPTIKLKWHYRSKFDELIHPSNKEIYNELITFPASKIPSKFEGVSHEHVRGQFIDSVNQVEADKVVELVIEIIRKYGTRRTVGVVTFNTQQRDLIERKINLLRRKTNEFEHFFNAWEIEKFFVKNIETVQGDERDIIILSVGYGPNAKGIMTMNFGPLNQQNGYRRLNVAVTRAKTAVIVVSSFLENDIDLSRTNSRGAKFLKNYIRYAASANKHIEETNQYVSEFDSPFEDDVYNELKERGYNVVKRIGSSGYKIDLAILDPKKPGHYILGIECDGSVYKTSRSSRDREILRQRVLEGRKWNIYRIWSTDWYKNKTKQVERLTKFIEHLTNNKTTRTNSNTSDMDALKINVPVEIKQKAIEKIQFNPYPNYEQLFDKIQKSNSESKTDFVWALISELHPIHYDELKKFIPRMFGRKTFTAALKEELDAILNELSQKYFIDFEADFIVAKDQIIEFREHQKNSSKRDFARIHLNEVEHFLSTFIVATKNLSLNDIMMTFSKYCGFTTITPVSKDLILRAIDNLINNGLIQVNDDILYLQEQSML
ncbi:MULTISPECIES: DUF4011 domain-containing protein [unclassified Mycoplasma]|uniref:DUF4011 domain-containing protein n=1 Tax=unclassified Mycoplasma TaxID=2683645 RepID=UPI00211BA551|nr:MULTISPECIES: DUF4011 domain-containing protein [unclassified Mycoplasma]UUM19977.1 DUF4011 domain-containing protein [Mycoplasma sp. 1578d]UUM24958.1 DUF4011 domain-containing protein [Mycoplasma sp. 3686d]